MTSNKKWNWEQKDWPNFSYNNNELKDIEAKFLHQAGILFGVYKHISEDNKKNLTVDIISDEALKTSEIEGKILNRESLQSSIRRNLGLDTKNCKILPAEQGISELMMDLYDNFSKRLTQKTLFEWHKKLTLGRKDIYDIGRYRTHKDTMQVVSGTLGSPKVNFEAPPSDRVQREMNSFVKWFNDSSQTSVSALPPLTRAGIAHLYFVSIHPFEDGNGRVARALALKSLAQYFDHPTLIALSTVIQNSKKKYYDALEASNKKNEITSWLVCFAKTILEAQEYTQKLIEFLDQENKYV